MGAMIDTSNFQSVRVVGSDDSTNNTYSWLTGVHMSMFNGYYLLQEVKEDTSAVAN